MTVKSFIVKNDFSLTVAKEVRKIYKIKYALEKFLYVPDTSLKPKIIWMILNYLRNRFQEQKQKKNSNSTDIKAFIAYEGRYLKGFVIADNNPYYTSRNRKAASFGWLFAENFDVCEKLLSKCEEFAREQGVKIMRGPINFPKSVGGYGLQVEGFKEQMMYGVAFNEKKSSKRISKYLQNLGFKIDAEYLTMEVTEYKWKKGTQLDKDLEIRYLTIEEFEKRKDEVLKMMGGAFYSVLPDAFGVKRFNEVMELMRKTPKKYFEVPKDIDFELYSTQPEFLKAWQQCAKEDVLTFFHLAFEKKTDKIVGIIIVLPDLYEHLKGGQITRGNVDVAAVRKGYARKGIFSSLNNIGRLTGNMRGITYFEGTSIWNLNEDAIKTILPHGTINRRFHVFQKRIKRK
jgi:hypothetical protein